MAPDPAGFTDSFARPTPPSQRRPRRDDVVTYRVRVDLAGTEPPLWRRLELASDLMLDDVHDIVQATFGWQDYHLHRFGSGPEYFNPETEYYLMPFEVEEGETGIPEEQVRLDEVLVDPGERLYYNYDFGDDWQHVIKLEAVLRREADARAVCTDGRRPAPAEDCGGIHGYELICAAIDSTHPDHAAAVSEHARMFGDEVDPAGWAPTPFEPDAINEQLLYEHGQGSASVTAPLAEPVQLLVTELRDKSVRRSLKKLISDAQASSPDPVDAETARRMVRPYRWLLDRVGEDGIKLTGAGYLPPVHVKAAWTELDLHREWISQGNREDMTLPVLQLRESAQKLGLLRKYRGRLRLTARGRAARTDPVTLWTVLAARLPVTSQRPAEGKAGLILLLSLAANETDDVNATIAQILTASGWMMEDGSQIDRRDASYIVEDTDIVLRRIGAFEDRFGRFSNTMRPTPEGVNFARAALHTWPAS